MSASVSDGCLPGERTFCAPSATPRAGQTIHRNAAASIYLTGGSDRRRYTIAKMLQCRLVVGRDADIAVFHTPHFVDSGFYFW